MEVKLNVPGFTDRQQRKTKPMCLKCRECGHRKIDCPLPRVPKKRKNNKGEKGLLVDPPAYQNTSSFQITKPRNTVDGTYRNGLKWINRGILFPCSISLGGIKKETTDADYSTATPEDHHFGVDLNNNDKEDTLCIHNHHSGGNCSFEEISESVANRGKTEIKEIKLKEEYEVQEMVTRAMHKIVSSSRKRKEVKDESCLLTVFKEEVPSISLSLCETESLRRKHHSKMVKLARKVYVPTKEKTVCFCCKQIGHKKALCPMKLKRSFK